MNNKTRRLYFLGVVLLFLAGAGIYLFTDSYGTFRVADRDFSVSREMDIVRIQMSSADGVTVADLSLDEQGNWWLNNSMPANDLAIRDLMQVLSRLRVWQPVSVANSETVEQMLQSEGVRVDVFVQAYRIRIGSLQLLPYRKRYQSFLLGSDTPDGQSTYMRKTRSDQAFKVYRPGVEVGVASLFDPHTRIWRDPVIFRTARENIDQVTVTVVDEPGESFVLKTHGDGGFAFYHPGDMNEPLPYSYDTLRVVRFLSSFNDVHYESLPDEQGEKIRKELMFEKPFMEISVQRKDGTITGIRAFARLNPAGSPAVVEGTRQDPNRFYVEIGPDEFALAQYYVFNRILRPLSFFSSKN